MSKFENDDFGNRMKQYEAVETSRKFDQSLPLYARLDGRSFSRFTRGLHRPYDDRFLNLMADVTQALVKETKANAGFCQSDEISLVWAKNHDFDGKIQKIVSTLASSCTAHFMHGMVLDLPPDYFDRKPNFDCRVINLPDLSEASNMVLWRHMDGRRNGVSMVAQHYFSHATLQGKKQAEMLEMLSKQALVDYDTSFPENFRYGTFIVPRTISFTVDDKEADSIPEAYRVEGQTYIRTTYNRRSIPFVKISNRVDVLFSEAEPFYRGIDE